MCFCPPVQTLLKEIIIDMFKIYIYIFVHVLIQVRYKQKQKEKKEGSRGGYYQYDNMRRHIWASISTYFQEKTMISYTYLIFIIINLVGPFQT